MPDAAWGQTVLCYESAYLWVFSLANTAYLLFLWLLAELGLFEGTFGRVGSLNVVELTMMSFLALNAGLISYWFWRYRVAFQKVRWSNF